MVIEFSAFGIPVRVRPGFPVMVFLLAFAHSEQLGRDEARVALFLGLAFLTVLAHELGHALAGRRYGWAPVIELSLRLGVTYFQRRVTVSRVRRVALILLGPGVGAAVALVAFLLGLGLRPAEGSLLAFALETTVMLNVAWSIAHLVPVLPLDGGHLVVELASVFAPKRGYRIAAVFSLVLCLVAFVVSLAFEHYLFAVVTALLAFRQRGTIDQLDRSAAEQAKLSPRDAAYLALTRNAPEAVVQHATVAEREATNVADLDEARYLLAWGHFLANRPREARAALDGISEARARDYALEGAVAHDLGELASSLELFEQALPRATKFAEPRIVHAILETGRFEEAAALFSDALGTRFSARGVAEVQRAAFDAGADEASHDIGEVLFRRTKDPSVAFLVACASARLGWLDEGRAWLARARENGFARAEVLDSEPALAPLRACDDWEELRASFDPPG